MPRPHPSPSARTTDLKWLESEILVPAQPVLEFLDFLQNEAAQLRSWVPEADVAAALETARTRLATALRSALQEEAWLTVTEAASIAGVSSDAVRDWIRKEKVRSVKRAGGTYLVERRSLVLARAVSEVRRAS